MTFCIQLCFKRANQYHQETKYQEYSLYRDIPISPPGRTTGELLEEYSLYRDMPISPQRHGAMANRETETLSARGIYKLPPKKPLMT